MSDLTGKFGGIEAQLEAQHTEMMEALNTIAFALGAPPTIPTTSLADIHTQVEAIIDGLALLYDANITFHASLLTGVGQINTNTDTLINNSSLNAQRTIAAIYATFCACATDTPLLAPPIDITPTELVDEDKCRRIQFYLSLFGNWLNKIANYGASGAAITSGTISTLLAIAAADVGLIATGAEVGALAGPPGIIAGAAVGLIAIIVYTLGGSVLIDYANQFNDATLRDNMVQAMYAATNADEGYTAFKTTLLATMDTIPAEVIYTLWWTAWSNDVYSGSPVVDDSAFDGGICAPSDECVTLQSSFQAAYGGQEVIAIPMSYQGWYWQIDAPGRIDLYGGGGHTVLTGTENGQLLGIGHTDANSGTPDETYQFWGYPPSTYSFTIELCPTPFV